MQESDYEAYYAPTEFEVESLARSSFDQILKKASPSMVKKIMRQSLLARNGNKYLFKPNTIEHC